MKKPRAKLHWRSYGITNVGAVRKMNEDAFLDRPDLGVWAVADGMGGHAGGDVASQLVVDRLAQLPANGSLSTLVDMAEDRLIEANRKLLTLAMRQKERTIGSTVVAFFVRGQHAACLWAGDSRLYRIRGRSIEQMTQDHAMVEDLVMSGLITREEAAEHPQANRITRAIGAMPSLFLDLELYKIQAEDIFLLCSDGLYKELSDDEIVKTLNNDEKAIDRLIMFALERGAHDNVTIVSVRFEG
ncbi:MAG: serine/threonine-protein phosphatase [Gammaproteobacteria bacterium]|nr:serine/threonine-protein phosphatase [Gammaproteobacteria bacterium]